MVRQPVQITPPAKAAYDAGMTVWCRSVNVRDPYEATNNVQGAVIDAEQYGWRLDTMAPTGDGFMILLFRTRGGR
jgi:hypothetical protein